MRDIAKSSKIAVAMSGGVDSGLSAALLVEEGYDVVGFFMHLWHEEESDQGEKNSLAGIMPENRCCSRESLEAARKTAGKLDIPFYTVDYRDTFKDIVVDYFLSEYKAGRTPNPCVICNKWIKFGKLLDYARNLDCDYLATGHYSRLRREVPNNKFQITKKEEGPVGALRGVEPQIKLLMAADKSKDQSYFLWQLEQDQLEHILLPIGGLDKGRVRIMSREKNLPVATRPESFEVCFIPDSLENFLRRNIPEAIVPGPVLDTSGKVIGKHEGLPLYTYGQRRGFELEKYQGIPLYVVGIDKENNALIVGRGADSNVDEFFVEDVNWITAPKAESTKCRIRVRHQGDLIPGKVVQSGGEGKVLLNSAERGIAPGQSAVFYKGEEVLGGGVISF